VAEGADMSQIVSETVEMGRDAHRRHAWDEALNLLRDADAERPLFGDDLVRLAEAAWFAGDPDGAIAARERAYAGFLAQGDPARAAEMALMVASSHFDRMEIAIGNGWMGRARRLLEGLDDECAAHGWHAVNLAGMAHATGDEVEARRQARRAREIGERLNNRTLEALGLQLEGATLVALGELDSGMALIDEATVAAVCGELDPMTTGIVYCVTISVCRDLNDWRRAGEWTDAAERWCSRERVGVFPGVCRVHRAEVMHVRGSWADAEREARRACEELRSYNVEITARGLYEIGEVRRRVGDLEGAAEAFRQAHELNWSPEPGMSLLRLVQGDVAAAHASITRALAAVHGSTLARLRLLPAAAEIALAAADLDSVRATVAGLAEGAVTYRTPALDAAAAYAQGRLQVVDGDTDAAAATLRHAVERWHAVGAPYEVARARTALAEAYRAAGDDSAARLELESAKAGFERLGAIPDAERVDRLLGGTGEAATRAGQRVTRTFLFTDIVGSTPLIEALGDEAWEELIRWHDQTLRSLFDRHGGRQVRHTGDGFFIAFDESAAAVEAAVAVQRALAAHRRAHGFAPQVRIGMHRAEAAIRGLDYAGIGVHEAARIGALAEGGEILASCETVTGPGMRYPVSQPRTVRLKGLAEPVQLVSVEWR
jgi:class 3 adenylate cyclase